MSIVSYAQNFEDVILWRALKKIPNGFYIDVGANDPEEDSVTKLFYDQGWHGINIEPLTSHYNALVTSRPRDTNLRCASGATRGTVKLWECEIRGWATADPEVVKQHEAQGHKGCYHEVSVIPLTEVCEAHAKKDIHFLKIDVEGFEHEVIKGMDFLKFRPWIIVIESTKPNSQEEAHYKWEDVLIEANYAFAYFDGINRFYVSEEHKELKSIISVPPNIFDEFKTKAQLKLEEWLEFSISNTKRAQESQFKAEEGLRISEVLFKQTEARAIQAEARAIQAEARTAHAEARAAHAEAISRQFALEISKFTKSTSWRITAPLRALAVLIRNLTRAALHLFKPWVRSAIIPILKFSAKNPRLWHSILSALSISPRIKQHFVLFSTHRGLIKSKVEITENTRGVLPLTSNHPPLSTRAQHIYSELKEEIKLDRTSRNP